MKDYLLFLLLAGGWMGLSGCGSNDDATEVGGLSDKTVLDLQDLKANPAGYDWFDFRPNVEKLILAGDAETEHVAILWYTVSDGAVGLHFHAKTESVYVIDGAQTDAKGTYPTGTVYFNPPGSGHQITDSSGFFILAYASPPDFAGTDRIQEYTPVRIDTAEMGAYTFEPAGASPRTFEVPIDAAGGMAGEFIAIDAPGEHYAFEGNYLLVLQGSCDVEGVTLAEQMLVVARAVQPEPFDVAAPAGSSCLAMGVSFVAPGR